MNNGIYLQMFVYTPTNIRIETINVTEDELGLIGKIIGWIRSNEFGDFNVSKHAEIVSFEVVDKKRNNNFKTIKSIVQ